MADYKKHLGADLWDRSSVESIVEQLWKDREKKQWRIGNDVKIRDQVDKLAKFALWSAGIVKDAVSAQPYAALAWSGVLLLLPVGA